MPSQLLGMSSLKSAIESSLMSKLNTLNEKDFSKHLAALKEDLLQKKTITDKILSQNQSNLAQQIVQHEQMISSLQLMQKHLTQSLQVLKESQADVWTPLSQSITETHQSLLRLSNHKCGEKLFKPAFVLNLESMLSKEAAECKKRLGQFNYNPEPPVAEGVNLVLREAAKDEQESSDNGVYEGYWNEASGLREGRGQMVYPDGSFYEGYWVAGKPNGRGRKIQQNGDFYEGGFKDGECSGYGRTVLNDEYLYEGYWKNDQFNGKGKLIYSKGNFKVGEFLDGKIHGKGVQMWSDGQKYEGEFIKGQRHGYGKCMYPNGSMYEGHWMSNKHHGEGTQMNPDGKIQQGIWKLGDFEKEKKIEKRKDSVQENQSKSPISGTTRKTSAKTSASKVGNKF